MLRYVVVFMPRREALLILLCVILLYARLCHTTSRHVMSVDQMFCVTNFFNFVSASVWRSLVDLKTMSKVYV